MSGLLKGDLDVAQAMIYNEYAQVLEAKNPATGKLYQPTDLNVIDFNDPRSAPRCSRTRSSRARSG